MPTRPKPRLDDPSGRDRFVLDECFHVPMASGFADGVASELNDVQAIPLEGRAEFEGEVVEK